MQRRTVKIVHKGSYWSRHGRHKGMLMVCMFRNREAAQRKHGNGKMYSSVDELMEAELRNKRSAKAPKPKRRMRRSRRGALMA